MANIVHSLSSLAAWPKDVAATLRHYAERTPATAKQEHILRKAVAHFPSRFYVHRQINLSRYDTSETRTWRVRQAGALVQQADIATTTLRSLMDRSVQLDVHPALRQTILALRDRLIVPYSFCDSLRLQLENFDERLREVRPLTSGHPKELAINTKLLDVVSCLRALESSRAFAKYDFRGPTPIAHHWVLDLINVASFGLSVIAGPTYIGLQYGLLAGVGLSVAATAIGSAVLCLVRRRQQRARADDMWREREMQPRSEWRKGRTAQQIADGERRFCARDEFIKLGIWSAGVTAN